MEIDERHRQLGGDTGVFGPATSETLPAADGVGSFRRHVGGVIVFHPSLGAFGLPTTVAKAWYERGGPDGPIGYPNAEPRDRRDHSVVYSFEDGFLIFLPQERAVEFARDVEELSDEERRRLAVRRRTASPLVGTVVHSLRRLRDGRAPASRLEAALAEAGAVEPELIDRLVEAWDQIPADERARLLPAGFDESNLDTAAPLPTRASLPTLPRTRLDGTVFADMQQPVKAAQTGQLVMAVLNDDTAKVQSLLAAGMSLDDDVANEFGEGLVETAWAGIVAGYRPRLTRLEPNIPLAGATVELIGEDFAPAAADNTVRLYARASDGSLTAVQQVPSLLAASATVLRFEIPSSFQAGQYAVRVEVPNPAVPTAGPVVSSPLFFSVDLPLPAITSVSPLDPEPGGTVTVTGTGFQPEMALDIEPTQGQPAITSYAWTTSPFGDLTYVSATQLSYVVPEENPPGRYRFRVRELMPQVGTGMWSDYFDGLDVKPARYRITFEKFFCNRTTNEDSDDEIVFVWTIGADESVWAKTTTEYGSISARSEPYGFTTEEGAVFPPPGHDGSVSRTLFVQTDVYENDSWSEGKAAVQYIGKIAALVNDVYANPYTGAVEAGAPAANFVVDMLAKIFGGLDRIGSFTNFFSVVDLGKYSKYLPSGLPIFLPNPPPGYYYNWGQSADYYIVAKLTRIT